jgi:ClpP class serine protease
VSLIKAGKFKAEDNPFGALSDEAKTAIQARVDDYYGMFVKAIARGRGVALDAVRNGFGEGRVVGAREAVAMKMADRVGTLEDVVGDLLSPDRLAALGSAAFVG